MKNVKKISFVGLGIALYFVLSMMIKIPLISHIQTDLGYIAFGVYCTLFGWIGCIVGIVGCLLESLIISGWIPTGWMLGQLFIGLTCGIILTKTKTLSKPKRISIAIITVIISMFIGIGLIKTVVECKLYGIPFAIKFTKNCVACVADIIPMVFGVILAIQNKYLSKLSKGEELRWS